MEDKLVKAFSVLGIKTGSNPSVPELLISEHKIGGITVYVSDRIDKGMLFGSINDVVSDYVAEKTGKEIKEKIVAIKTYDETQASAYLAQANLYLKECDSDPDDSTCIGDYELRGTKMRFGALPMMFSWDDVYACDKANESASQNIAYGVDQKKADKPLNYKRLYNQNIRMYVESRVESLILQTVADNMDNKKRYKLSADQLSKLNF